jgi:integrase
MSNGHPTPTARPSKPYPDFPLFAHASGQWAKKVRGKMHYFGRWDDPDAALAKYLAERDDLHAGRKPRADSAELTVKDTANAFLNAKQALLDAGELSPVTFGGYKRVCDEVVAAFGKQRRVADLQPDDFAGLRNRLARKWGPVRLGNAIQVTRSIFKHSYDAVLIDRPLRFGPGFKRPSRKVLRLHKAKQGPKLFTAEEIRRLLEAADVPLKAMILLGINCGFGNADCGRLPLSALDLEGGMVDFARPKTGVNRRCPLWAETVQALKDALAARPEPKHPEHAGLVFVSEQGLSWHKDSSANPVSRAMCNLLRALRINGRKGLAFYGLRHSFRTVADETRDQPACDHIMGHVREDMASHYREAISDWRLRAVVDHVHSWLFPAAETPADGTAPQILPMPETA